MLFLLPPSESKRVGGSKPDISQLSLTFGVLAEARSELIDKVVELSKNERIAQKIFKLSDKHLSELELNRTLWSQGTLPAIQRYEGTLYKSIFYDNLPVDSQQRAREMFLIQSALFGLISASDRIPNYRFSASTKLPTFSLKNYWSDKHEAVFARLASRAPVIDLRSKAYQELAPVPEHIAHHWVEVVTKDSSGNQRALNHFNKKSKGEFLRAILLAKKEPETISDLGRIAKNIGFSLEKDFGGLRLVIPGN
ncbi:MAG: YaaA family protein [Micrococcales bacterium]